MIEFEDRSHETRQALLRYLDGREPWERRRLDWIINALLCLLSMAVLAGYVAVAYVRYSRRVFPEMMGCCQ
jgi:hypothetical protein